MSYRAMEKDGRTVHVKKKCDSKRASLKNEAIDLIDGTRSPALNRSDNRVVVNSSPFPQASPVQPLNPVVILIYIKNSANAIKLVMMITKRKLKFIWKTFLCNLMRQSEVFFCCQQIF